MSLVRAEMSSWSTDTVKFAEQPSLGSTLSDRPSSFTFAFSSLLNSSFSDVALTAQGSASEHLASTTGVLVQPVSECVPRSPLFSETLPFDEALATGLADELEANATVLRHSLLLAAVPRSIFLRDPLLCPDALLVSLLVDADPFRPITSPSVLLCGVVELINSLLGPELCGALILLLPELCAALLLLACADSRALPIERAELTKFPAPALLGTSGLDKAPRLRNILCSPVLTLSPALLDLTPA